MNKEKREVFNFQKIEDVPEAFKDKRFKGGSTALAAIMDMLLKRGQKQIAIQLWEYSYSHWLEMRKYPSGVERARRHFAWTDEVIRLFFENKPQDLKTISCKKACTGCCHQEVFITDDESVLLAKKIKDGLVIDRDRLKKQAKLKNSDAWIPVPKEIRKCVFLGDDNLCRIYADRPLSCRKYFVTTPPERCHDIGGNNITYMIHTIEAFVSAALNLKPKSGPMASMLLERLSGPV